MKREYYSDSITKFVIAKPDEILGTLTRNSDFDVTEGQTTAWLTEIAILKKTLAESTGTIYFEYSIPRMGRRIDVVLLIESAILILEFKIGSEEFASGAIDQVWDYALDLKNFHESSHDHLIAPILIATEADSPNISIATTLQNDHILFPIKCNAEGLPDAINGVLGFSKGEKIDQRKWEQGRYSPTPTIVEAAMALYNGHSVEEISRSDAGAKNLSETSNAISEIIESSKRKKRKSICFLTGVPGSGKTLVGLNIATQHMDKDNDLYCVFLSGNDPLVKILREALARDRVQREKEKGRRVRKNKVLSEVKMFVQPIRDFRDECLVDENRPPIEHVALFDEAQRAWNLGQTEKFMLVKRGKPNFGISEPKFLISCLDRHKDWAVVVCLVGGGQEINTGEAGIREWIESLQRSYPDWDAYISSRLTDSEYGAAEVLENFRKRKNVKLKDELHLAVSMRSFRAENVSLLVKQLLDLDTTEARKTLQQVNPKYPMVLTRDLGKAKDWLRSQARGSERYGIVVSSQAERLKPHAIDVKSPMDPVHWFLDGKQDVRSSYYLEDVATEFDIQGLELDWACITWDADFRHTPNGWEHWSFRGDRWLHIKQEQRQVYLKNAYRVLLTRARQGMVIVVPNGDAKDPTRSPEYYDSTFDYLKETGFAAL